MKEKEIKNNSNAPGIDIENYEDLEGLTTKKLRFGLWFIEHKILFWRILIVSLLIIVGVSWSYTIYGFAYYFTRGQYEDKKIVDELTRVNTIGHDYLVSISAKDLIYSSIQILKTASDKYDLITQIKNPNQDHWAVIEYCWAVSGKEIACGDNFILPEETKHLLALSKNFPSRPERVELIIKDLKWQRINKRKFPDWESFRNERLNLEAVDISFRPGQSSEISDKLNLNTLDFTVNNNTPYNYWEVGLNIVFYSGRNIVGVNQYHLEEFLSKEKRDVSMAWSGTIGRVSEIKIIPSVNILKDDIYIDYDGGVGEEK